VKIRCRYRSTWSPKEGHVQGWNEYQVVDGRKIVGRYDLLRQALEDYPDAVPDESVRESD
jgi:hypothetical protein